MKHVFLVNSHTTFLSSLGVIDLLRLHDEDVVLLYARNYANTVYKLSYKTVNVDHIYYAAQKAFESTDSKIINDIIRQVDEIIDLHIASKFSIYVPNFCNPLVCLLYSSCKCQRILFIQEAAQSVGDAYRCDVSIWKGIKRRIKFILRGTPYRKWYTPCYYRNDYIWKQGKMYSYALNDEIFKGLKAEKYIISWPLIKKDFGLDINATYFICDGWVYHNMCEEDVYIKLMYKLIDENASSNNYIKFHPNQVESERKLITDYFDRKSIKYEIMDQSMPFEVILSSYQGLKIAGMGSALCFFAQDMHHNVICHDDWCYENSELFRQHLEATGNKLFKEIYSIS